ncbi:NAD-dependent epimerase/dehydratase family protein [Kitasatospora sp. NPDC049285]|uniref:NAD-dependent epimerase/dehydratase family protein n=1 Tax=Kitasatospora sp. NPDC049285 TaxID=3157096 RepID=UPI003425982B
MLVSVTGGTGFLGIHSIAAIVRAGHRVRLLARDPAAAERALARAEIAPGAVDVAAGDATDTPSVERAVRGADAVLHAASVYSFDSRRHQEMRRTNEHGTETVLAAARRSGAGRIIHVSSIVALLPAGGRTIGEHSPVGRPRETYMATKAAAEHIARSHQSAGAPVVISYPPALLGPADPRLGDQTRRLRNTLRGLMPFWPTGGFPVGDVRDTAQLHARLLTAEPTGTDRHFGPGRHLTTRQYLDALREVTGRPLPALHLPARAMLPIGAAADLLQRAWPWQIPAEYGAVYTCATAVPVEPGASTGGLQPRPAAETMADTVRWLHGQGLLTDRQAGAIAGEKNR